MNMAEQSLPELSAPHGACPLPCESKNHTERIRAFAASRLAPSIMVAGLLMTAPLAPLTLAAPAQEPAPTAPRARLLPPSTPSPAQAVTPQFPAMSQTPASVAPAASPVKTESSKEASKGTAQAPRPVELSVGGAKVVKVNKDTQVEGQGTRLAKATTDKTVTAKPAHSAAPASSATASPKSVVSPATPVAANSGDASAATPSDASVATASVAAAPAPNLEGMGKVIRPSELTLPPLSQPLPDWMRAASVRVERLEKQVPPAAPAQNKTRLAQNPVAPPVRPAAPVTNSDRLSNQIEVSVSSFVVLLTTTDLQTVAVADPTIADVAVVNSRAVLLNGRANGTTSLVIVDGQKIRQYSVRVTASPGSRPMDVATAIGIPGVTVRQIKDALVLEGEVSSDTEAKRAAEIAGIFAPKVINQLAVRGTSVTDTSAQLRDLIAIPGVNVRAMGDTIILSGQVESPSQVADAEAIARTAGKNVINQLKLPPLSVDEVRQSLGAGAGVAVPAPGTVDPATAIPSLGGTADSVIAGANPQPVGPGRLIVPTPLTVREVGGQIVLEGEVATQGDIDLALSAANRTGLPVVNRLTLRAPLTAEQTFASAVAAAINMPGVRVSGSNKRLILEGTVPDTNAAVAAEQIARGFAPEVDVLLQTPNPLLVDVDISIAEITDNGLKNLGFQFPSLQDASTSGFVLGQRSINLDSPGALPVTTPDAANPTRGSLGTITAFQAALRAEVRQENAHLLSNPHTTVLSGRTATFQVGGQVPVPVSITQTATGTVTGIAFKDYGVLVDVVPNADAKGNVTLRLRTEVSQPDTSVGFTPFAGATPIPGFTRRSTVSEVTIPKGGTLALSGLISRENRKVISEVPILSRIPVLGSLFKSRRFVNNQSELVIFVTPHVLPNSLPPGTLAPAGVVAAGNTTNRGTILGNPGIPVFNSGITISGPGGGAGQ